MIYALIENGIVTNTLRVDPISIFPAAYANRFVSAPDTVERGSTFDGTAYTAPPPQPPPTPRPVTMRQARLALLNAGLLATVNAAVAAMPGAAGDAARIEWEFSSEVFRNRPLVLSLGTALGLTAVQLEALFVAAAAIV